MNTDKKTTELSEFISVYLWPKMVFWPLVRGGLAHSGGAGLLPVRTELIVKSPEA